MNILTKLRKQNITLSLADGKLKVNAAEGALNSEILDEIRMEKESLIAHLKDIEHSSDINWEGIKPAPLAKSYPLTAAQHRLYFLYQLDSTSLAYNMPQVFKLNGNIDYRKLAYAIDEVVQRHESLRTSFETQGDEPVQVVSNKLVKTPLSFAQLESTNIDQAIKDFIQPFDLHKQGLIRVHLVESDSTHYLMVDMHHIIADGISQGLLIRDFIAFYNNEEPEDLKIQYKDYAHWLTSNDSDIHRESNKQYWADQYAEVPAVLDLPYDFNRNTTATKKSSKINFTIDRALTKQLQITSDKNGGTLFSLLLSCYYIWLNKLSTQEDIVVGVPVHGREYDDLTDLVGMFANALPIRASVDGRDTFCQFLQKVIKNLLVGIDHQGYPIDQLINDLQLERDLTRNPLFDVIFAYEDYEVGLPEIPGVSIERYPQDHGIARFDLSLQAKEVDGEILLCMEYRSDLFKEETMERFITYFISIANTVASNPEIELSAIQVIDNQELALLNTFKGEQLDYDRNTTVVELFENRALTNADAIAITFKNNSITYGQLNNMANRIANEIQLKINNTSGAKIGLHFDPSIELIASMLGVLKAGHVFVPLSPVDSLERKKYIVDDCQLSLLVVSQKLMDEDQNNGLELGDDTLLIQSDNISTASATFNFPTNRSIEDLIYVIYTSGTTGRPKGVAVKNQGILNMLAFHEHLYHLQVGMNVSQVANISFDASMFEIWPSLVFGGHMHIAPNEVRLDPLQMQHWLIEKEVEITYQPTAVAEYLLNEKWDENKTHPAIMSIAGDRLNTTSSSSIPFRVYNLYGPTEDTIWSTWAEVKAGMDDTAYSIGKPIGNKEVLMLDQYHQLVPFGVAGELCIAGDGLANGYINAQDLTNQKFIAHPLKTGEKIYKTGDLARWLPDGNIEFLGRIDNQVKIRGYRIELEEVSGQLLNHEAISACIVLALEEHDNKYLVAYYAGDEEIAVSELRRHLLNLLPEYMVPAHYVYMQNLPLTSNGKVNKKALPKPQLAIDQKHILPANEIERKMVEIWSEVLKIEQESISVTKSFFELGGHSLRAASLINKVNACFDTQLPLSTIFDDQNIRNFSRHLMTGDRTAYAPIPQSNDKAYYQISSAQRRMHFLNQFNPTSLSYNMPHVLKLEGELELEHLKSTFLKLIEIHESLRTIFVSREGVVYQQVIDQPNFDLEFYEAKSNEVQEVITQFIRPFDLGLAPLIRVGLISCQNEVNDLEHLLMLDMHHIISDGVSHDILIKDFITLYQGGEISDRSFTYKDYAEWQHSEEYQNQLGKSKAFWLEQFADEVEIVNLPYDFSRPLTQSFDGGSVEFSVNAKDIKRLEQISEEQGATMFMVLMSVFNIFLSKISNQQDLTIGSPVAGREREELRSVVGMFVNMLPLRNNVEGGLTFKDFLSDVKKNTIQALEYQAYPYEELISHLRLEHDLGRNPLFDCVFSYENFENEKLTTSDLALKPYKLAHNTTKFDLMLEVSSTKEDMVFRFEYATDLFESTTIERFVGYFRAIIHAVANNSAVQLKDIEVISNQEKQQILREFNHTSLEYDNHVSLVNLFEKQVSAHPDENAVVCEGKSITYKALNQRSNQLATYLNMNGTQRGDAIGLLLDRSIDMIVGILGVLKAGAGYVPIDNTLPDERVKYMLQQSKCQLIITQGELSKYNTNTVASLDIQNVEIYTNDSADNTLNIRATDFAYCIYTSGSTGLPKGVMITHRNVINLVNGLEREIYQGYQQSLNIALLASYAFDVSVQQIFGTLLGGHTLYIATDAERKDGAQLKTFYNDNAIDFSDGTPTHLRLFLNALSTDDILQTIKGWMLAGEALPKSYVEDFYKVDAFNHIKLYNIYGPTEACVYTTCYEIKQETLNDYTSIPIGKPLPNVRTYIVDAHGTLVPKGVPGQLCIGGDGLALGYFGDEQLTAEKFNTEWIANEPKVYCTGDLARWLPDGNIEYLGRIDSQVKLHGYRIELGEIEYQLSTHAEIKNALVTIHERQGNKYLTAYYESDTTAVDLKAFLVDKLPEYMIPTFFIPIDKVPLNVSGKINYKLLPLPEIKKHEYVGPSNDIENVLIEIWSEVLELDKEVIGINNAFFDLGGNSINIAQLRHKILERLEFEISIADMFRLSTIALLSNYIINGEQVKDEMIDHIQYSLSEAEDNINLFNELEEQLSFND